MTIGITLGLALGIFIVVGIVLARRQSATKREAIADLQREKEALGSVTLRALAEEEATDLGLPRMRGAAGVPLVVLLKVWKAHEELRNRCPSTDLLEFVLAEGVQPQEATEVDVYLRCNNSVLEPDQPAAGAPGTKDDQSPEADSMDEQ